MLSNHEHLPAHRSTKRVLAHRVIERIPMGSSRFGAPWITNDLSPFLFPKMWALILFYRWRN